MEFNASKWTGKWGGVVQRPGFRIRGVVSQIVASVWQLYLPSSQSTCSICSVSAPYLHIHSIHSSTPPEMEILFNLPKCYLVNFVHMVCWWCYSRMKVANMSYIDYDYHNYGTPEYFMSNFRYSHMAIPLAFPRKKLRLLATVIAWLDRCKG